MNTPPSKAQLQKIKEQKIKEPKQRRFAPTEVIVTLLVITALVAVFLPWLNKFVAEASQISQNTTVQTLFVTINGTLLLANYTNQELAELAEKYSTPQPLTELQQQKLAAEQGIYQALTGKDTPLAGQKNYMQSLFDAENKLQMHMQNNTLVALTLYLKNTSITYPKNSPISP